MNVTNRGNRSHGFFIEVDGRRFLLFSSNFFWGAYQASKFQTSDLSGDWSEACLELLYCKTSRIDIRYLSDFLEII